LDKTAKVVVPGDGSLGIELYVTKNLEASPANPVNLALSLGFTVNASKQIISLQIRLILLIITLSDCTYNFENGFKICIYLQ
jgi:hypothetical protein